MTPVFWKNMGSLRIITYIPYICACMGQCAGHYQVLGFGVEWYVFKKSLLKCVIESQQI